MALIAFTGYAPDLPPETPGIIVDCANLVPHPNGYRAHNARQSVGAAALAGAARGFGVIRKLDNTKRIFAATQTKIYELAGATWSDVSAAGDYDLGSDAEVRARFAQFGDVTLAAVSTNKRLQQSSAGAFAAIAGAPMAKVVETVNNFVFVFNFIDDTHGLGTAPNGWWCAGLGSYTDWAPSVATQSVSGTFIETSGPVIGARRLGSNIIAYKDRSAFIGQYVGAPQVWAWTQLPGEVGAISHESIVNVGTAHYFISAEDFQMFDGSRFVPIDSPLRNTFFADLDPLFKSRVCSSHDRTNGLIYWFYPSRSSNGTLDKCIIYNYRLNKWGRADQTIEIAADYISSGITYDTLGSSYATYDDLPTNISYDSSFWTSDAQIPAVFDSSHIIQGFTAMPTTSSVTPSHFGDVEVFSTLSCIRPRFLVTPTSGELVYSHSNTNADVMTQNINSTLTNNRFDLLWSARWHKLKMNFVGAMTMPGFDPTLTPDGEE